VHLGRAERDEPLHLARLVLGVEVEVDARRDLHRGADPIERNVRPVAIPRSQQREIITVALARDVTQRRGPERFLTRQIIDPQHDRTDA
jgi:hypothetical protein